MPSYTYVCKEECGGEELVICPVEARPSWKKCPSCGHRMRQLFGRVYANTFKPYITTDGGGEFAEIRSSKQEDAYCQKHHISRMLDSEQFDHAKSKRKRKERAAKVQGETIQESIQIAQQETGQKLIVAPYTREEIADNPSLKKKRKKRGHTAGLAANHSAA